MSYLLQLMIAWVIEWQTTLSAGINDHQLQQSSLLSVNDIRLAQNNLWAKFYVHLHWLSSTDFHEATPDLHWCNNRTRPFCVHVIQTVGQVLP